MKMKRKKAPVRPICPLQDDRSPSVAEETSGPWMIRGKGSLFDPAGHDQRVTPRWPEMILRDRQRENKTGTGGLNIKRGNTPGFKISGDQTGRRRKNQIGSCRR